MHARYAECSLRAVCFCSTHRVVKVAVQPKDVGVAEVALDLNLTAQLVLDVVLLQLALEEHLRQRADSVSF
jgi:hypothetical protein